MRFIKPATRSINNPRPSDSLTSDLQPNNSHPKDLLEEQLINFNAMNLNTFAGYSSTASGNSNHHNFINLLRQETKPINWHYEDHTITLSNNLYTYVELKADYQLQNDQQGMHQGTNHSSHDFKLRPQEDDFFSSSDLANLANIAKHFLKEQTGPSINSIKLLPMRLELLRAIASYWLGSRNSRYNKLVMIGYLSTLSIKTEHRTEEEQLLLIESYTHKIMHALC